MTKLFLKTLLGGMLLFFLYCSSEQGMEPPDGEFVTRPQQAIPWPSLADSPWPMYRHDPQGTGRSPFAGSASQPEIKWMFPVSDKMFSSPVIGPAGRIYFGSDDKNFYCVDPSGSLVWSIETESPIISSPLVLADSTIVFGNTGNVLFKTDPEGKIIWQLSIGAEISSSITIDLSGNLYFVTDDSHLYSVDPSGFVRWKVKDESVSNSFLVGDFTPVFSPGGNTIYAGGTNLLALNLDGSLKWRFTPSAKIFRDALVDSDGNIYFVTSENHVFYSIDPGNNVRWQQELGDPDFRLYASPTIDSEGNVYTVTGETLHSFSNLGELRWRVVIGDEGYGPLSCDINGSVYYGSTGSVPSAFIAGISSLGDISWRLNLSRAIDVNIAIHSDGTLYFGTSTGFAVPDTEGLGLFSVK